MIRCPVSVLIPTYNREPYLARAIRSVQRQTVQCSEIIVIDDGSTDNTQSLVAKLQQTSFTPIKYFRQENKGPAAARNTGIRRADYDYVAFLDSDDHWQRRKLQVQYEQMQKAPQYLISHTREKWLRRGVHLNQKKVHIPRHGEIFNQCLQLCVVGMSTIMARKKLFGEVGLFDETLSCCEDYDMWLRVSSGHSFLLIDAPLTVKEGGRDDQVSVQYRAGMDKYRIASLVKILHSIPLDSRKKDLTQAMLVQKALIYGSGCLKHGKPEEGGYYLQLAHIYACK